MKYIIYMIFIVFVIKFRKLSLSKNIELKIWNELKTYLFDELDKLENKIDFNLDKYNYIIKKKFNNKNKNRQNYLNTWDYYVKMNKYIKSIESLKSLLEQLEEERINIGDIYIYEFRYKLNQFLYNKFISISNFIKIYKIYNIIKFNFNYKASQEKIKEFIIKRLSMYKDLIDKNNKSWGKKKIRLW